MQIYHSSEEYKHAHDTHIFGKAAVTLGKFDGIHIGHRKLIERIMQKAREENMETVVFSIETGGKSILSHEERADYLESLGVDHLVECPFSKEFMQMTPDEFIQRILIRDLDIGYAAVGEDFRFGAGRSGCARSLKASLLPFGFVTDIIPKERWLGEDVSSTRVRYAIEKGDMELIDSLLGRPLVITGIVRHGQHIGTGLNMPTINVIPAPEKLLPPFGVYASVTSFPDKTLTDGVTNIGIRPTTGLPELRSETTLFDFDQDVYGMKVTSHLIRFVRPERKFDSFELLKMQVDRDKLRAREILAAARKTDLRL